MHLLSSTVVSTVRAPGPRSLGPARWRRLDLEIAGLELTGVVLNYPRSLS